MEPGPNDHEDFGGLSRDRHSLVERRKALQWFGALGMTGLLAACTSDDDSAQSSGGQNEAPEQTTTPGQTTTSGQAATESSSAGAATDSSEVVGSDAEPIDVGEIADETAGPFPADGTNGPNLLETEGVVRADLTNSIGDLSGTAEGVPTTIDLTVIDAETGLPMAGAAVYLWHCTADGQYTIYELENQNYLRGMQAADETGRLSFTTIFPGCYRGRWPHCHFEVYRSLDEAAVGSAAIKTSQLALPEAECALVYEDSRYGESGDNLSDLSLDSDGVFEDGWDGQMAAVSGSTDEGYTASLVFGV